MILAVASGWASFSSLTYFPPFLPLAQSQGLIHTPHHTDESPEEEEDNDHWTDCRRPPGRGSLSGESGTTGRLGLAEKREPFQLGAASGTEAHGGSSAGPRRLLCYDPF